jgi:histidine triad (HIT) family protein
MTSPSPTIFTRIIRGEISCEKVLEDDRFFAFLDIRPIAAGHTLVVPKHQIDKVFDLETEELREMLPFAQRIARALEKTVDCRRIGMLVAGFEVPHAHLHLVPIREEGDLSFSKAKPATKEELAKIGAAVRAAL